MIRTRTRTYAERKRHDRIYGIVFRAQNIFRCDRGNCTDAPEPERRDFSDAGQSRTSRQIAPVEFLRRGGGWKDKGS